MNVLYKCDAGYHAYYCPGCKCHHAVFIDQPHENGSQWTWNGSFEKPTFSPSILYPNSPRCHSFVRDGMIEFLPDSNHELAGKTVPMESVD